jgi:hypothetical protein
VRAGAVWVLLGLLVTVLLVCGAHTHAADLTVAAYRSRIGEASELARKAATAPEQEAQALLRQAAEQFPAAAPVRPAKGISITAENRAAARWLATARAGRTPRARAAAIERFQRQAETLAAALAPEPAGRSAREASVLASILSRPPFALSPFERWEREVQERWRNWWQGFARRFLGSPAPATMERIARAAYWVVLALLVALLMYLIWTYVPGLSLPRRAPGAAPGPADEIAAPERARARLAAAEAAAAEGRYLDALRQTYAAMLLILDEAHLLPYDPARTNHEILRALRAAGHAPVRDLLAPVTRAMDEKLYGGRPATAADYQGSRDACARLMGLLSP